MVYAPIVRRIGHVPLMCEIVLHNERKSHVQISVSSWVIVFMSFINAPDIYTIYQNVSYMLPMCGLNTINLRHNTTHKTHKRAFMLMG